MPSDDARRPSPLRTPSALHRQLPQLVDKLPALGLGRWPTAVRRLDALSEQLGVELWVKSDDASSRDYGGNKVRKLELLLAAARKRGARRLLTVGGIGSNQVLATAIHGARALGLPTRAVVVPQPATQKVLANLERIRRLGVDLIPCKRRAAAPAVLWAEGRQEDTYTIGPGGSSPLGSLGYVAAGLELGEQVRAGELPPPDEVVLPLGSGGTAAGLWLGLAAAELSTRLVCVRVVERALCNGWLLRLLARRCRSLLERHGVSLPPSGELEVVHEQAGPSYGTPTPAAEAACQLAARQGSMALETTYSGKAFAALIARAEGGKRAPGPAKRVLFWNTHSSAPTIEPTENATLSGLDPRIASWI
ncbi:MAG: 1-aminocyclopropane-1-carboxylate deaminase [Proteobacteria bacterium]|nr:MAG: 1-aminocyclopropane-1-carboxylate deaminase [Pseudomonadota bacterium]